MTDNSIGFFGGRALLVNIIPPEFTRREAVSVSSELFRLVYSLGGITVVDMFSRRAVIHSGTYVGPGRLEELARQVGDLKIDYLVLNGILKPRQLNHIWRRLSRDFPRVTVWDRIDLILSIFQKHAHTYQSQLEIRLAAMRHMGPRIYGLGREMSQQLGGIGVRGIGETNVEIMKRHWREEVRRVGRKLKKIEYGREVNIRNRRHQGIFQAALVGYTNAGKSSLFNFLTGKKKFVRDYLFATLDTTVGRVYLPDLNREIIISDTIGFIRGLPPELVRSFKSTLAEAMHADLLIHVIDVSDPEFIGKKLAVDEVVGSLGIGRKPILLALTKTDIAAPKNVRRALKIYASQAPVSVSSVSGFGKKELVNRIASFAGSS